MWVCAILAVLAIFLMGLLVHYVQRSACSVFHYLIVVHVWWDTIYSYKLVLVVQLRAVLVVMIVSVSVAKRVHT